MTTQQGRHDKAFVGIPTFLRSPYCADLDQLGPCWAVLGMPFDEGSPFAPGSRFGPRSIREHSLRFNSAGVFDCARRTPLLTGAVQGGQIIDIGDVDVIPGSPSRSLRNLSDTVARILDRGARPLTIGGDHTITFPVLRAFKEPVHVVQLDAHLDYMPVLEGLGDHNAQSFRRMHSLPQVLSLTQIGIRGLRNDEQDLRDALEHGSRIVHMPELREHGAAGALSHIPAGASVYLSIDIDAYDSTLTPGCVSAEPGGITFEQMEQLLDAVAARFNLRGFDLVEVNPQLDVGTGVTSYLAAHTLIGLLGRVGAAENVRRNPGAASGGSTIQSMLR
jgi:agmatinase